MDGGSVFLKLVSLLGLLLAVFDYFDITRRLEAGARRMSTGLWSAYGRYWHYVYHSTESDRTGFGKVLAELGGGIWKLVMVLVLFGTLFLGREAMEGSPLFGPSRWWCFLPSWWCCCRHSC